MDLERRVAVVTGAASGIGLALVERFLAAGMSVVMADVEAEALRAAADPLLGRGLSVLAVPTDVSDPDAVDRLAQRTLEVFGAVHLVCNNAGVTAYGRSWELGLDEWRWVIDVNLWGVIHGIRTFVPLLVEQGEGHIVNTSSMAGVGIFSGLGPYLASKHAVAAVSEGLAMELDEIGSQVGVSVLCPGFVRTNILESDRNRPGHPRSARARVAPEEVDRLIGRGIEPSEVAEMVAAAVQDGQFWIFTHPRMLKMVERRVQGMLSDPT